MSALLILASINDYIRNPKPVSAEPPVLETEGVRSGVSTRHTCT